jgi:RHS repeat-associated protein
MSGKSRSTAGRRTAVVTVAGVLAVIMTVDPLGVSAVTAIADTLESREENFDDVVSALGLEPAAEAVPLTGAWGALPGAGGVESAPAIAPTEDEQVVVLTEEGGEEEPGAAPASFITFSTEEPPAAPAPVSLELGGIDVTVAPTAPETTPAAIRLRVAGAQETAETGITGVLLDVVDESSTPAVEPEVELTVSYETFAGLVNGDWASRLRFVWIPECEVSAPCVPIPIETVNNPVNETVTAVVPVLSGEPEVAPASYSTGPTIATAGYSTYTRSQTGSGGGGSVAITAGASGSSGDWGATSLAPSSTWGSSGSTGSFTWSLPIQVPTTPAGPAPEVGFSYSSAGSDGRTPSTNNQSGPMGEGFSITESYVERSYESCQDDESGSANNIDRTSGDLCWGAENATMVFNGSAIELIRDAASGEWHAKNDDGSRIQRITGSSWNSGEANEYWKVTTTDGTQYFFGRGKVTSGGTALNSAWTVPVYGNHPGERCHSAEFADSRCSQVWRWNLEYVVDVSGNSMTYFYDREVNRYVFDLTENYQEGATVAYVAGGHLIRIEYGTRAGSETTESAPAKVEFAYTPRCITDLDEADSFCSPSQSSTTANHWLDTPTDLICTSSTPGDCENYSPVFFNLTRLSSISTLTFDGAAYQPVDKWTLNQTFDPEGTGIGLEYAQNVTLVLRSVAHTGQGGTTSTADDLAPPPFVFSYEFLSNRVDAPVAGPPLLRPRVNAIRTDSGAQVSVNYLTDCSPSDMPGTSNSAQAANTRLCFPVKWYPNGGDNPVTEYFHKYVVDTVVESGAAPVQAGGVELITGSVAKHTRYEYSGGAAWAKPTGAMVTASEVTYSDFRGFKFVTTTVGLGDESSRTRSEYFQGVGGTLTAGPAGFSVTAEDHERHQGQVFVTTTLSGATPIAQMVTVPGAPVVVAENSADLTATRLPSSTAYSFRFDASGALVDRSRMVTTYNAQSQVTTIDDRGDLATSADDTCATTAYAHSANSALASKNLVALPAASQVVAAACDAILDLPADLISSVKASYDASGRLLVAERLDPTDGVGHDLVSEVLEYDSRGRILAAADSLGNVTLTTYQESPGGLLQAQTVAGPDVDGWGPLPAFATTTTFNPLTGLISSVRDTNGRMTTPIYDTLGRLVEVTFPQHQGLSLPSAKYEYRVDPSGLNSIVTTTLGADGSSQHVSSVLYDGLLREFQTQGEGRDAGQDDNADQTDRGRVVSHTYYDSAGRLVRQTSQWWAAGAPSSSPIVPAAVPPALTTYEFDTAGRAAAEIFWVGTDSNPANERWRTVTAYDGDTTLIIPPLGATPTAEITDARGVVIERIEYLRDPDEDAASDTPTEVRALPHQSTTYKHDATGLLVEMQDPGGNLWEYEYDWARRLILSHHPDAGTTATTYDLADRVVTRMNGNGEVLAYTYDALGRVTSLRDDSVSGPMRAEWGYDQTLDEDGEPVLGHPSSSTRFVDGNSYITTVDRYDDAYRPLATTFTLPDISDFDELGTLSYETKYAYTVDGQVASVGLPAIVTEAGGKVLGAENVTTFFDAASTPSWMSGGFGWGTYVADSSVTPDGRAVALDLGNTYGAVVSYRYEDGTNRLANISLTRQQYGVGISLNYGYDVAGNVTSIREQSRPNHEDQDNQCFGYDGLSRLEVAWASSTGDCGIAQAALSSADAGGVSQYWTEFEYDELGNRTRKVEHAISGEPDSVSDYSYGGAGLGAHQLGELVETVGSTATTTTFAYDDAGNRISATSGGNESTYAWDVEGELTALDEAEHIYDASGSRIVRTDETGTTVYLPGGQELLISPEGEVSAKRYYSFGGQLVAVRHSTGLGGVDSLVVDHQGSVVGAVSNTEWTAASLSVVRTDPFGGARSESDEDVPGDKRFLGLTRDASSGLSLFGARFYEAETGTFLSADPAVDPANPAQFNAYTYAWNNPVTHSDPSGLEPRENHRGSHAKVKDPPPGPLVADRVESFLEAVVYITQVAAAGDLYELTEYPTPRFINAMRKLGFDYGGDGLWSSRGDAWQHGWGYHEAMDWVHSQATDGNSKAERLEFEHGGASYRLWWWKGQYLNLGTGGEVGIYRENSFLNGLFPQADHWEVAPIENTPLMSTTVRERGTNALIAESAPGDPRQWVYASNARVDGLSPDDIVVEHSMVFPSDGMFEDFIESDDFQDLRTDERFTLGWNPKSRTVTFSWRRRRR